MAFKRWHAGDGVIWIFFHKPPNTIIKLFACSSPCFSNRWLLLWLFNWPRNLFIKRLQAGKLPIVSRRNQGPVSLTLYGLHRQYSANCPSMYQGWRLQSPWPDPPRHLSTHRLLEIHSHPKISYTRHGRRMIVLSERCGFHCGPNFAEAFFTQENLSSILALMWWVYFYVITMRGLFWAFFRLLGESPKYATYLGPASLPLSTEETPPEVEDDGSVAILSLLVAALWVWTILLPFLLETTFSWRALILPGLSASFEISSNFRRLILWRRMSIRSS